MAAGSDREPGVRLAELLASVSLAIDLGLGQPAEHVLRSCRIAMRLGEELGLGEQDLAATYYVTMLSWVGCHADSHEQATWFGDDIAFRAASYDVDMAGTAALRFMAARVGAGRPALQRAGTAARFVAGGRRDAEALFANHCYVAGAFARRLGLAAEVADALQQVMERWDGHGGPAGLREEEIALPTRLSQLADIVEVFHRRGGVEAAAEVARARRGTQFDPALVDRFRSVARDVLEGLDDDAGWEQVIGGEPGLRRVLSGGDLDAALEVVADFADVKSPYTLGHSRGVAALAAAAAAAAGATASEVMRVRRAGLLHDIGRMGVSNRIWDKPGPLTAAEFERVRMHPYLTQRVLASVRGLPGVADVASRHHERLDGSGYHAGLTGAALSPHARLVAAADSYQAMVEPRPHRPALGPEEAAAELRREARSGRLDAAATDAVLAAAGHRTSRRRPWPAELTDREVEVLRLAARGHSNREIAGRLHLSSKTVGNHIEHIYVKIGVRTRAAAGLFAVQHGLLGVHEGPGGARSVPGGEDEANTS